MAIKALEQFKIVTQNLKNKGVFRSLRNIDYLKENLVKIGTKKLKNFASNDYFNLSQNSAVKKSAIKALRKYGASSASSRYICGNNSLYQKLEERLAKINQKDDAIVFSSGYQAAIGVIPALVDEGDLVIADKLIHACLIDGIKLSKAKLLRFKHNDLEHAKQLIEQNIGNYNKILIISEEIFSMDGDKCDFLGLLKLKEKFDCELLIDCAHSLYDDVIKGDFVKIATMSKALGSFGGYVCADFALIEYLRNLARSQIYTTALPPCILAASIKSLEIISKKNLAPKTLSNANYFCELMGLQKAQSAIVMIEIADNEKALQIAKKVEELGFLISAIRPPTVLTARLRISFCANHKKNDIKKLAKALDFYLQKELH